MGSDQSKNQQQQQLQAVGRRVSSFESEQMQFNVQSGQRYSELSSNLTRTQNEVSNVQQELVQQRRDQNSFNRSAMAEWNRMNSQMANMNSRYESEFSRVDNRLHSINSDMKDFNRQLIKQEYAIDHYAKNQANINESLARRIHEENMKIIELEKHGDRIAQNVTIIGDRTLSLRADLNSFTDQMKNLLSSMQEGMGSFKNNQERFNETTIHALEKLEKQISEVNSNLHRWQQKMRRYMNDQHEKSRSFKTQLNKQNDMIFWLITFLIALMSVLATIAWNVFNK